MGRYLMTIGAVAVDGFFSALTWVGQISPAALVITLLTSGVGVLFAANTIAEGVFNSEEPAA